MICLSVFYADVAAIIKGHVDKVNNHTYIIIIMLNNIHKMQIRKNSTTRYVGNDYMANIFPPHVCICTSRVEL